MLLVPPAQCNPTCLIPTKRRARTGRSHERSVFCTPPCHAHATNSTAPPPTPANKHDSQPPTSPNPRLHTSRSYMDDTSILLHHEDIQWYLSTLQRLGPSYGISLNLRKTTLLTSTTHVSPPHQRIPHRIHCPSHRITIYTRQQHPLSSQKSQPAFD